MQWLGGIGIIVVMAITILPLAEMSAACNYLRWKGRTAAEELFYLELFEVAAIIISTYVAL